MRNRTTSNNIQTLLNREVFVFGSNSEGRHYGGAARIAHEKFGAIMGNGHGPQGQCYAIDTMSGIDVIKSEVEAFIKFAESTPHKLFLVTELGCGIAGFTPKDIAPFFKKAIAIENIHLPESFWVENDESI